MTHTAEVRLHLAHPDEARRILLALSPENGGHVDTRLEGATLVATARADTPLSLLHTLDDLLACASAAQKAGDLVDG